MRQRVLSVPFPLRFLFASQPKIMGKALGIIYRTIATHFIHNAGYKNSTTHTGAVTQIQRFGSALNLKFHFDVQGRTNAGGAGCAGAATYRIAVDPQKGRKVFGLQTLPDERDANGIPATGNAAGISLHAGVAAKADECDKVRSRSDREGALGYKLERLLCRYITRPAIAENRLSLTKQGKGRWKVTADQDEKTPARRHVAMAGFCSCKTGIHAVHGNNMGSETKTRVQH